MRDFSLRDGKASGEQALMHLRDTAMLCKAPGANGRNHIQTKFPVGQRPASFLFGMISHMIPRAGGGGTLTNDYGQLPQTFQGHHLPSAVIPHPEPVPTLLTGLPKGRQGARLLSWSSSGHRFALPRMHAWQNENHQLCLVEQSWNKGGTDPKALACHGVLWQEGAPNDPQRDEMWLRFVTGRPKSRSS